MGREQSGNFDTRAEPRCLLVCLPRAVLYAGWYFQKQETLSRHRVRKRQGPSLKTQSLNPTVPSGCQRCTPRSPATTLAPSSLQKLLLLILLCVFSFFGISQPILLTIFLCHLYLVYCLNIARNLYSCSTFRLINLV